MGLWALGADAEYYSVAPVPRLFSYVVAYDTGFAPHVFNGMCTLATCKPKIRRNARRGDWVIGTSGRRYASTPDRIVYLMQVTEEPMSFDDYDRAFPDRRPSPGNPLGDNIYFLNPASGRFEQRPNPKHGPTHAEHDLSGESVPVSHRFVYFGKAMPEIPDGLDVVKKGPGHRSTFDPAVLRHLLKWTDQLVGNDGWNTSYGRPNE